MGSARRAPGRAAARLGGATTAMRACLWLGVLVATAHGASPPRSRPRLRARRRSAHAPLASWQRRCVSGPVAPRWPRSPKRFNNNSQKQAANRTAKQHMEPRYSAAPSPAPGTLKLPSARAMNVLAMRGPSSASICASCAASRWSSAGAAFLFATRRCEQQTIAQMQPTHRASASARLSHPTHLESLPPGSSPTPAPELAQALPSRQSLHPGAALVARCHRRARKQQHGALQWGAYLHRVGAPGRST